MNVSSYQASPVQSTQKPTQIQKTEQAKAQQQSQEPEVKKTQAPPPTPTPVVNTQGQTTGRVLNVTA